MVISSALSFSCRFVVVLAHVGCPLRLSLALPGLGTPPPPPLVSLLSLQKFEEIYLKECAKARPAPEAKFNYAWALIRSPARPDIRKGVIMMSGLLEDRFSDRDCLYYMAHGHYRLDDVVVRLACTRRWIVRWAGGVKSCCLDVGEGLPEPRRGGTLSRMRGVASLRLERVLARRPHPLEPVYKTVFVDACVLHHPSGVTSLLLVHCLLVVVRSSLMCCCTTGLARNAGGSSLPGPSAQNQPQLPAGYFPS